MRWFAPEQPVSQLHWVSRVPAERSTLVVRRHSHKTKGMRGAAEPFANFNCIIHRVVKWRCFGNLVDCVVGGDERGNPCFQYLNMLITYKHVWSCTYSRRWRRKRESDRERERKRERSTCDFYTRWSMVYLLSAFARHSSSALEPGALTFWLKPFYSQVQCRFYGRDVHVVPIITSHKCKLLSWARGVALKWYPTMCG